MVLGRRQGPQSALFSKAQGAAFRGKPASEAAAVHFLGRGFWKFLLLLVCISDLRIKALWSLLSLQGCETPVGAGRRVPRPLKFGSFQSFRGGGPWLRQHPAGSCPEGASRPRPPGGLSLRWVRGRRQRPLRPRPCSPRKSPSQGYPIPPQGCRFSFGFSFPAPSVRPRPSSTGAGVTPPGGGEVTPPQKAFFRSSLAFFLGKPRGGPGIRETRAPQPPARRGEGARAGGSSWQETTDWESRAHGPGTPSSRLPRIPHLPRLRGLWPRPRGLSKDRAWFRRRWGRSRPSLDPVLPQDLPGPHTAFARKWGEARPGDEPGSPQAPLGCARGRVG